MRLFKRLALAAIVAGGLVFVAACIVSPAHPAGCSCCEPGPAAPPSPQQYVYRCTMDGGERDTPGPCPKCGMTLDERYRVPK